MIASSCSTIRMVIPSRHSGDQLVADPPGKLGVDSGHRLVQQQQLGIGHQRSHDLDQPALAAAEVAGVLVGERLQAEPGEYRGRPGYRGRLVVAPVPLAR